MCVYDGMWIMSVVLCGCVLCVWQYLFSCVYVYVCVCMCACVFIFVYVDVIEMCVYGCIGL